MKIAFVMAGVLPMPPIKGGAVENLVDFILKKNEENFFCEIDVYTCEKNHDIELSKKYKNTKFITVATENENKIIKKIKSKMKNKLKIVDVPQKNYIKNVAKSIEKEKYDVVIIENRPIYVPIIRKYHSGILVLHIHNDTLNKNTIDAKKILNDTDYIFAISEYIKKRIVEIDENSKQKVKLLYNGIEVEKYHMSPLEKEKEKKILFKKYGLHPGDKVIIYSGRLVREKGVIELIKAFKKVENLLDNIKLLIVGSALYGETIKDEYLIEMQEEIATTSSKVVFTGFVDYNEINRIYNIADIGVVPSIWQEPAALTALEIQAAGLPIIATNTGGLTEMVANAGIKIELSNTFVDDLAKSILELLVNQELYELNSKKSVENSKQYSTEVYFINFKKLIKDNLN